MAVALSVSVSVLMLAERLAPHITKELNLVIKSKEEAEFLSSKLKKIHVGLQDAERQGVTNNAIKEWLKEVQEVAYKMEDVLEEGEALQLQVKLQGDVEASFLDKARSHVLFPCSYFKLTIFHRRKLTKKMKALSDRIDKLLSEKDKYNFLSGESDHGQEFKPEASTSLVNKLEVYGRDAIKDSLVRKLITSPEEDDHEIISDVGDIQIVSIVGIGGVGKTTLAQLAYNDDEVDEFFIPKGWVSVSEPFDTSLVAKAILEQFGESWTDAHNLETLVQRIKKAVEGKKFLLVLDNVWTENGEKWTSLKNCLQNGARGSRILVTTRSESVGRMMGTNQWQPLSLLSDLECSQILNGIALNGRRMEEREKLGGIGVEIAKKCNGLPLAARSVGSMLALKSNEEEWRAVIDSPLWNYGDEVSNLFRLLNLSYIDLSPMLKRCFLSSIVLPKGAFTSIDKMIKIWMAHGYLSSKDGYDQVQLQGLRYFSTLEMRSFFQKFEMRSHFQKLEMPSFFQELISDIAQLNSYKMHDIMHEFAKYLSGSEYSLTMDGGPQAHPHPHHSFPWNSLGKLRTFCATNVTQGELPLNNVLSRLKSVRVLSLCDCNLQLLPEGVGELVHLRYLELSGNPISELPQTVCNLYNLQTLGIKNCRQLLSLPEGIGKLVNLRHLLNGGANNLVEYSKGFELLTSLWTLSMFKGSKVGHLENMNKLQGHLNLDLSNLEETADAAEQVRKANLGNKKHIHTLVLNFGRKERQVDIEEALQPPPNLQSLYISTTSGKWFSHWVEKSLDNLKKVSFRCHGNFSTDQPPFGKLPALEKLVVIGYKFKCLNMDFLGLDGKKHAAVSSSRRAGGFPKLKKLSFIDCFWWEEWEDTEKEGVMRCLEELEIKGCNELKGLPHFLLGATSLKILNLSSDKLYDRYNEFGGVDHHQISYIPKVIVNRDYSLPNFRHFLNNTDIVS